MADYACTTGAELNTALGAANPGDTITLTAGNTFSRTGAFTLGDRGATKANPITIRTSQHATLPNRRMQPGDASRMPLVQSTEANVPVFTVADNGDGWTLRGLHITATAAQTALVDIGDYLETVEANQPVGIVVDRCYIHGANGLDVVRGVALHGADVTVRRCWIDAIWKSGQETQAIWACNGPGPFLIEDNFISSMGECFMSGGAEIFIENLIPSDFTFRYNTFSAPLTKNANSPLYDGLDYAHKNVMELKTARRVLFEFNLFENAWIDAQSGYGILLTSRQDSPWSTIEDVTFRYNVFQHMHSFVNILTMDDITPDTTEWVKRIRFEHNLFRDGDPADSGAVGASKNILLGALDGGHGSEDVVFDHNTFDGPGLTGWFLLGDGTPNPKHTGLTLTNNVFRCDSENGIVIFRSGGLLGTEALDSVATGYTVGNNLVYGDDAYITGYPANTWKELATTDVGFASYARGDLRLTAAGASGDYRAGGSRDATDGTDLGANVALALRHVVGRHSLGQGW